LREYFLRVVEDALRIRLEEGICKPTQNRNPVEEEIFYSTA
jgi:hypothetical protein